MKRFKHEPKGFCCSNGKILSVVNDAAENLYELFMSNLEETIQFRKYIRLDALITILHLHILVLNMIEIYIKGIEEC